MEENIFLIELENYIELHACIKNRRIEEILNFIKLNPFVKVAVSNGNSAIAWSLKCGHLKIYELLVANGFKISETEDFNEIMNFLDEKTNVKSEKKMKLREIHRKYMKESTMKHLFRLNLISKLATSTPEDKRAEYDRVIIETFEELSKIPEIDKIMRIVAYAKGFQFYFDFNGDTIEHMNPTVSGRKVYGLTCLSIKSIYIGAKNLLDPELKFNVQGTLVHEMLHQVINMIYDNDCKPYLKDDKKRREEYKEVVRCSRIKVHNEVIFKRALGYFEDEDVQEAEAIVRPAHVKAVYMNNEQKLSEIEKNYHELYAFYRSKVLPDIDKVLVDMRNKAKELQKKYNIPMDADDVEYFENLLKMKRKQKKLWTASILTLLLVCSIGTMFFLWSASLDQIESINSEFNGDFVSLQFNEDAIQSFNFSLDTSDKLIHLKSNCVFMTILAVYDIIKRAESEFNKYFFINLTQIVDKTYASRYWKAHDSFLRPTMIIDGSRYDDIQILNALNNNVAKRIILITESTITFDSFTSYQMNHSWSQLSNQTQNMILRSNATFQGVVLPIGEILEPAELENDIILNRLVSPTRENLKIGEKLEELEVFVERDVRTTKASMFSKVGYYSFDKYFQRFSANQTFLFPDNAGQGKTTEMKMIAKRLKTMFPSSWVLYFDLKKYVAHFKSFENTVPGLVRFLGGEMLKFDNFELELFNEQFQTGRVFFLMDGVDEVSPSHTEFIQDLLTNITSLSKNKLWVTTRPHLSNILKKALKPVMFFLQDFNVTTRAEFFTKYNQMNIGENKTWKSSANFTEKLEEFIRPLETRSHTLGNGLILKMIVEVFIDNPNETFDDANLYSIYDGFTRKMIANLVDRGNANSEVTNFMYNYDIVKIHQKIAFELTYENSLCKFNCKDNFPASLKALRDPTENEMTRIGLMYKWGEENKRNYQFVHNSFKDFFISKFYFEKIFKQESIGDDLIQTFETFWNRGHNSPLDQPIYSAIQKDAAGHTLFSMTLLDIAVGDMLKTRDGSHYDLYFSKFEKRIHVTLATWSCRRHHNLIKFVVTSIRSIDVLWVTSIIQGAIECPKLKGAVNDTWSLVEGLSNQTVLRDNFLLENSKGQNILNFAFEQESDDIGVGFPIFEFLMSKIQNFNISQSEYNRVSSQSNPLWNNVQLNDANFNRKLLEKFIYLSKNYKLNFSSTNSVGENLFHFAKYIKSNNFNEIAEEIGDTGTKSMIMHRDNEGRNVLLSAISDIVPTNYNKLKVFWDFFEKNFTIDEKKKVLKDEDIDGGDLYFHAYKLMTGIEWVTKTTFPVANSFQFVLDIYENVFGHEEVVRMAAKRLKDFFPIFLSSDHPKVEGLFAFRWMSLAKLLDYKYDVLVDNLLNDTDPQSHNSSISCEEISKKNNFAYFIVENSKFEGLKRLHERCPYAIENRNVLQCSGRKYCKGLFFLAMRNEDQRVIEFAWNQTNILGESEQRELVSNIDLFFVLEKKHDISFYIDIIQNFSDPQNRTKFVPRSHLFGLGFAPVFENAEKLFSFMQEIPDKIYLKSAVMKTVIPRTINSIESKEQLRRILTPYIEKTCVSDSPENFDLILYTILCFDANVVKKVFETIEKNSGDKERFISELPKYDVKNNVCPNVFNCAKENDDSEVKTFIDLKFNRTISSQGSFRPMV